jgi:hypothetical protein
MRFFLLLISLHLSSTVLSNEEHKFGQEGQPSRERLSRARECFSEIKNYGCSHPKTGQENFNTCLAERMEELTPDCQAFFERLYGMKGIRKN